MSSIPPSSPFHKLSLWALFLSLLWPCLAHAQVDGVEDYERGMKLVAESRAERERDRRAELLADAESALQSFVDKCPEDDVSQWPEPKSFDEAKAAGRAVMYEIQKLTIEMPRTSRDVVAANVELEPVGDGSEDPSGPDTYKAELKKKRAEAIGHFKTALKLADEQTPSGDVDVVRYFLCYLYYSDDDYDKAAKLGEDIARHHSAATGARQSAKIAVASYAKLYSTSPREGRVAREVVKRVDSLAGHTLNT